MSLSPNKVKRVLQDAGIRLELQPKQALAYTCPGTEILYGGAAGGGKSHFLRVDAISCCTSIPKFQAYIFRRNYPDLRLNHMQGPTSFPELLAPLINARMVQISGEEIRFWNGSRIHLCHLQYGKSLLKYQGAEIHALYMDELTHFEEHMYRYLRGRCRLGSLELPPQYYGKFPRIVCGSNPGGVGHQWVKRTFIKLGPMRAVKMPSKHGGMVRIFIPAVLHDNPALLKSDPDYESRLEALGDPVLVRAMLEGDWDVVAGAMFGDTWRRSKHVCRPFPIPVDWKMWRGADDGFGSPSSVHWLAEHPHIKTIYVAAELYRSGMLPDEFARRIREIDESIVRDQNGRLINNREELNGIMDSGAFAKTGQAPISRGDQLRNLGIRFKQCDKWPGSRVHRVQNFHRVLGPNEHDPEGGPGIVFFDTCRHAIETIPALSRDKDNIEDIDTDEEDHAFDSVTYGLQWKDHRVTRVKARA